MGDKILTISVNELIINDNVTSISGTTAKNVRKGLYSGTSDRKLAENLEFNNYEAINC